ncbi:MAG: hypothetical protein JWO63_1986 [Frankiales bacterium]|jgi:hypothetical protein|nr:hypothetical protein [Frankiales bacterium]
MSRKMWSWVIAVAVLAAVDVGTTIDSIVTWKRSANGPTSATIGQVLGVFTSVGLLLVLVMLVIGGVRSNRRDRNAFRPR